MMLVILKYGGFTTGGLNFDAKVRRRVSSRSICSTPTWAAWTPLPRASRSPRPSAADGKIAEMLKKRYASWDSGVGAEIEAGRHDFASLEKYMLAKGDAAPNASGRQVTGNFVNRYVF